MPVSPATRGRASAGAVVGGASEISAATRTAARARRAVSDSFGAREKRLIWPPYGGAADRSRIEQGPQPVLIEDLCADLLRLGELCAGALARHQVVGVLRDGARHLAAGCADHLGRFLAAEVGQGPGEHEGLVGEGSVLSGALGGAQLEAKATLAQSLDQLQDRVVR